MEQEGVQTDLLVLYRRRLCHPGCLGRLDGADYRAEYLHRADAHRRELAASGKEEGPPTVAKERGCRIERSRMMKWWEVCECRINLVSKNSSTFLIKSASPPYYTSSCRKYTFSSSGSSRILQNLRLHRAYRPFHDIHNSLHNVTPRPFTSHILSTQIPQPNQSADPLIRQLAHRAEAVP